MFDAILYVATTGCQWRMVPNDSPPLSTVRGCFYTWRNDGLLNEIIRKLVEAVAARYPILRHVFADGGYAGPKLHDALTTIGRWTARTVKRSDTAQGFEVLPRR